MTDTQEKINALYEKIKEVKSEECIMDYDTKTEMIEKIKKQIEATLELYRMNMSAGMPYLRLIAQEQRS